MRSAPPACYGKLPARADFVLRRLPRATVEAWDMWMQACLGQSREILGSAWQDRFLTAPPWRLVLPKGACGGAALAGVLVPSVDAVGRCFPLLIAQELPEAEPALLHVTGEAWFAAAEALALGALTDGFDLDALDRPLPVPQPSTSGARRHGTAPDGVGRWTPLESLAALPDAVAQGAPPGRSPALWWTRGGAGFAPALGITAQLIAPRGFAALLDGDADRHGWERQADRAGATLAWDREA